MAGNRIFLYPMKPHERLKAENPYLFNLAAALHEKFTIVNYGRRQGGGAFELFRFLFKADVFYFNWIENRASRFSLSFFHFYFSLLKALGKKIVWTHHNIHPHNANAKYGRKLIEILTKKSDYIITHTRLSADLLNLKKSDIRLLYYFHPFFSEPVKQSSPQNEKKYDLLIWGNIRKSKGIDVFMDYLHDRRKLDDYKIKIIGRFESAEYYENAQKKYAGKGIEIENRFADTEELRQLHEDSKYIFFPYTGSSVLNSGALITSLPYGSPIIGPRNGAFTEIGEEGLIYLYSDFDDVLQLVDQYPGETLDNTKRVQEFCTKHTWRNFVEFLSKKLVEKTNLN